MCVCMVGIERDEEVWLCLMMRVCVCVSEKDAELQRERKMGERVCVLVCAGVRVIVCLSV